VQVWNTHELVCRRGKSHRHDHLVNQLRSLRADDAGAQDHPALPVRHHLDEALGLCEALRFPVLGEIVAPAHVGNAEALQLFLAHADCGNLRIGENGVRANDIVVSRFGEAHAGIARGDFALIDRNVNQHVLTGYVADGIYVGVGRAHRRIDFDSAPRLVRDPSLLEPEPYNVGHAPECVKNLLADGFALVAVDTITDDFLRTATVGFDQRRMVNDVDAFLAKIVRQRAPDVVVALRQKMPAPDEHRRSSPHSRQKLTELAGRIAAAQHDDGLRNAFDFQQGIAIDIARLG